MSESNSNQGTFSFLNEINSTFDSTKKLPNYSNIITTGERKCMDTKDDVDVKKPVEESISTHSQGNTESNLMPIRPIIGFDKITTPVLRNAIHRMITEICNTDPKNLNLQARVKIGRRMTIVTVSGLNRLVTRTLNPGEWSLDTEERNLICDIEFDVANSKIVVKFYNTNPIHSETAIVCPPFCAINRTPPDIDFGNINSPDFIPVSVSHMPNMPKELICIASMIATNVLACSRRRANFSATIQNFPSRIHGQSFFVVETRGILKLDRFALGTEKWNNFIPADLAREFKMYFDVQNCVHRTRFENNEHYNDLVNIVRLISKQKNIDITSSMFGFQKTYDTSKIYDSRKRTYDLISQNLTATASALDELIQDKKKRKT